jgi:hypothetical protein
LSPAAREALLQEIDRRGSEDPVVCAFEQARSSELVCLDRVGMIVVFDALWTLAEQAGGDDLLDPQLRRLRDQFREEIAQRSSFGSVERSASLRDVPKRVRVGLDREPNRL